MNTTVTNSTLKLLDDQLYLIGILLLTTIQIINFSLGIPLNICLIFYFIRAGGVHESPLFIMSQCVSEVLYALSAPLYVLCKVNFNVCFFKPMGFFAGIFVSARPIFQCCVSLEHYLAVVHPVIFLKFKPLRYRLGCLIVTWTFVLFCSFATMFFFPVLPFDIFGSLYLIILAVNIFCCFSVLNTLRQSGPGKMGREESWRKSKKKAFEVVFINLLTYLLRTLSMGVIFSIKYIFLTIGTYTLALAITVTLSISGRVIQVLLYLYKAGKLTFCKCI